MRRAVFSSRRGLAAQVRRGLGLFGGIAAALLSLGTTCDSEIPAEGPPQIEITLNAVADDLNDLLIVPADDFVINVDITQGGAVVDPGSFLAFLARWGGSVMAMTAEFSVDTTGGHLVVGPGHNLLDGTYTLFASIKDVEGELGWAQFDFAARTRAGAPPIGTGQKIWYDFASDRDGVPGPDFTVDLRTFGLGSTADPALSSVVEGRVIDAVLARVSEAYHQQDPNDLGGPDPVDVTLHSQDPGGADVTRICVGGADPSGGITIGSILIDPQNSNRASVECGTVPPTGIFPREMTYYQNHAAFQLVLSALMPALGGTPIGENPLDAIVLAPGFDPGSASTEEATRLAWIELGIRGFADALGSIVAHETGHALGLVAPSAPGVGLHGGASGASFSHDVTASGSTPASNYLMKRGGAFNFARLAGLSGYPLPYFRPLDFAYLRDRAIIDPGITALLMPPTVQDVSPASLTPPGNVQVTVTGANFAAIPAMQLISESYIYQMAGASFVDSTQVQAWVVAVQIPPGTYDLVLTNPDGQADTIPDAFTVFP